VSATSRHVHELRALGACREAVEWAATKPDMRAVWRECPRGDWMLWLVGRLSGSPGSASRRRVVLASVECARLVEHLDESGAAKVCLDVTEAYALRVRGVTLGMVRAAAAAADAADAAYAAADAADAAYAAAAYAADTAAAQCAEIVRRHYPRTPTLRRKARL